MYSLPKDGRGEKAYRTKIDDRKSSARTMGGLSVDDSSGFDVEVDGTVIITTNLDCHGQNREDDVYAIPEKLTSGKEMVTITFRA